MSVLPLPPANLSFAAAVNQRWNSVRSRVERGQSVRFDLAEIEEFLADGRTQHEGRHLKWEYDWGLDLEIANDLHKQNLQWIEDRHGYIGRYFDYWKDEIKSRVELNQQITLTAYQFLFAINGAIALGALNGLTGSATQYKAVFGAALGCSIAGILLTGAAIWYAVDALNHYNGTIQGALVNERSVHRLKLIYRYTRRTRIFKWGTRLNVTAILWTASYMVVCAIYALHVSS